MVKVTVMISALLDKNYYLTVPVSVKCNSNVKKPNDVAGRRNRHCKVDMLLNWTIFVAIAYLLILTTN